MFNKVRITLLTFLGITALSLIFIVSSNNAFSDMSNDKLFQYAIKVVLAHEGGLSHSKNDKGSWTKFGISLRFIRNEHLCIDGDCADDSEEIIHLTLTEADKIYYSDFWKKYHYDQILDKNIATKAFDMAVNAGPSRSNLLLKKAINLIIKEKIQLTSELDEETLEIINNIDSALLHQAMKAVEAEFYKSIIKRNPSLACFEKGWLARAAW